MNAFYQRLIRFGALLQQATLETGRPLEEYFTLLHPSHPVRSNPHQEHPLLEFNEDCPLPIRKKVRAR